MTRGYSRGPVRAKFRTTVDRDANIRTDIFSMESNNIIDWLGNIETLYGGRLYLSLQETAMLIGVSTRTLRRHANAGDIGFSRHGFGRRRIRRQFAAADVARFCARGR